MMSIPTKQVKVFTGDTGQDVERKVNAWLSDPAHRIYEVEITPAFYGHRYHDHTFIIITYWEPA